MRYFEPKTHYVLVKTRETTQKTDFVCRNGGRLFVHVIHRITRTYEKPSYFKMKVVVTEEDMPINESHRWLLKVVPVRPRSPHRFKIGKSWEKSGPVHILEAQTAEELREKTQAWLAENVLGTLHPTIAYCLRNKVEELVK